MSFSGNYDSTSEINDSSMTLSPTLTSIVTHMKKGYGSSVQNSSFSSRLRESVNSLVNEVRSLNRSYAKEGTESSSSSHKDDYEDPFQVRS